MHVHTILFENQPTSWPSTLPPSTTTLMFAHSYSHSYSCYVNEESLDLQCHLLYSYLSNFRISTLRKFKSLTFSFSNYDVSIDNSLARRIPAQVIMDHMRGRGGAHRRGRGE